MSRTKRVYPVGLNIEGNKGGSFISIDPTERDDVVRLRVGHDCVHRIDTKISVFALAAILAHAKDIGFRKMIEDEYSYQSGKIPDWCGPIGDE